MMEKHEYLREHLSQTKDLCLKEKAYKQDTFKPRGIWYQIDGSWEQWVSWEMPEWGLRFTEKYKVEMDLSNVLVLDTVRSMIDFTKKYREMSADKSLFLRSFHMNWERVAEDHDGIEIPEYFHELRMEDDFMWYYSWDVACGCVWNTKAIRITGHEPVKTKSHHDETN